MAEEKRELTNEEKISMLANQVMEMARNTIVVKYRFLDMAVNQLKLMPGDGSLSVDGQYIHYDEKYVLKQYRRDKNAVNRRMLHMFFHCVFKHFLVGANVDYKMWDLASDIAVEAVIEELGDSSFETEDSRQIRQFLANLQKDVKMMVAEKIYAYLRSGRLDEAQIRRLEQYFYSDNHFIWHPEQQKKDDEQIPNPDENQQKLQSENQEQQSGENAEDEDSEQEEQQDARPGQGQVGEGGEGIEPPEDRQITPQEMEEIWTEIAEYMQTDMETFSRERGKKTGALMQSLMAVNREKYDYEDFLKKFSVYGEKMTINDDEFDYIFYTYGLSHYGNMPLIEPLEYKDLRAIKEFVVAIDTSASVSGELVQKFVKKTYNILKQEESYFTKVNLHIIQCDTEIHEDKKITTQEEFDEYMDTMELKGFGGTDFRPVFEYVDELVAQHEFTNLKGLIYFTDGYGTFPEYQPRYSSAFVFVEDDYSEPKVPVWAIKLVLQSDEVAEM